MLECQRELFDLPDDITYFNSAYQSPLLKSTVAAGEHGLRRKLHPYNITKDDFFEPLEEVKSLFAELVDCDDSQRIVYQPSVSYGIANVIRNLVPKPNGNIVVLAEQFPSNALGYIEFCREHNLELRTVAPPEEIEGRGRTWNQAVLDAIDENTICVSIPHCHWSDGTIFHLKPIREKTTMHSALLIIDGTQSVGALPFSVREIDPDALIVASYKFLLGPYGSALSYYGAYFDDKEPIEHSWMNRLDSDQFHRLSDYSPTFRPSAYRYNVGECANFIALPMLADSLRQILVWQPSRIQEYCLVLFAEFGQEIKSYGYQLSDSLERASHLFGLCPPPNKIKHDLMTHLAQENIHASLRGNFLRLSPYMYNSEKDVGHLLRILEGS